MRRRRGFTLIEVMAAVLILGLLISLAAFSFAGALRRARLQDDVEQIRDRDAAARQRARETGRAVRVIAGGREIDVSPLGLSESYALEVSSRDERRWVFVSGLSGQVKVVRDYSQVESILSQVSPRRHAD